MEQNVNTELLAACKIALQCIARLTPMGFPSVSSEVDPLLKNATEQVADYADSVRDQLRIAIYRAENPTMDEIEKQSGLQVGLPSQSARA